MKSNFFVSLIYVIMLVGSIFLSNLLISIAVFLLIIMTGEIFGSYIIEYNDILDSIKFNKKFKVYGSD